jgi:hypothetical protein
MREDMLWEESWVVQVTGEFYRKFGASP